MTLDGMEKTGSSLGTVVTSDMHDLLSFSDPIEVVLEDPGYNDDRAGVKSCGVVLIFTLADNIIPPDSAE